MMSKRKCQEERSGWHTWNTCFRRQAVTRILTGGRFGGGATTGAAAALTQMRFFTSDDFLEEWPLRKGERDPLLCFPTKGGDGGTLRVSSARLDQLKEQAAEAAKAAETAED